MQKTPLDGVATLVVHSLIDKFMNLLMKRLGYTLPKFVLTRYCKMWLQGKGGERAIVVRGVDEIDAPFSCLTQITLMCGKKRVIVKGEPYTVLPSILP